MHAILERIDQRLIRWMARHGHRLHRVSFGALFVWFGLLKTAGLKTATSLLAHTVYWGDPETVVIWLGWWEVAIGITLLIRRLNRIAILLLLVRLPGTLLALVLLPEVCFEQAPWLPTPEGQYLVKDALLFFAAIVIGGTLGEEARDGVRH